MTDRDRFEEARERPVICAGIDDALAEIHEERVGPEKLVDGVD